MPEPQPAQRTSLLKTFSGVAIAVVLVVFIGSRFADTKKANSDERQSEARSNTEPSLPAEPIAHASQGIGQSVPGSNSKVNSPRESVRNTRVEDLAAAMNRAESALGACDRCRAKLDKLPPVVAEWKALVSDLEKNETGRRLASSEVAVRTYMEVMNPTEPYAEESQLVRLRERLRLLEDVPKRAKEKQDYGYIVAKSWDDSLAVLDRDISKQLADIEQSTGLLKTLLEANPNASPEAPTLATAIGRIKQKLFDDKLAAIMKREAEAVKSGNERIAEARKLAVETDKKLEAKKSLDEAATKEDNAKREVLRVKAKTDEVKKYLGHLFVESYYQPTYFEKQNAGRWLHMERTDKKLPMSYARIVQHGGTADGLEGLYALNMLSGACGTYNIEKYERPMIKASYDPNRWTNDRHEFLEKGRDLLKELGPILVEEGLLSK